MSEKLRSSSPTNKGLQQTGTGGTNINVAIRCRPTTSEESKQSQSAALVCDTDNKSLTLSFGPPGKKTAKNYAFEKCFDAQATQEDIFESVARPVVNEALAGFNCTIFAYGQTGDTNRTFSVDHHQCRCPLTPAMTSLFIRNRKDSHNGGRLSFRRASWHRPKICERYPRLSRGQRCRLQCQSVFPRAM